ncbi:MAG: Retron-type reverse transcriptase [Candidatus Yanofskybacteria bacterium GW2011_GWA2_44_10]|nr:MAG: Retron-type reverse transcriptase [Candidatus Yanofskybacteria bacterium GW2011_GWA2_44_10]
MKIYKNIFEKLISLENLFTAWDAFKNDKTNRYDVQVFERRLEENIFELHRDLKTKKYKHGVYTGFWIRDPKPRHIHKATVRDRVLHHAVFNILNPIFEPTFISHSFSCRIGKGTHKGIKALKQIADKISENGHKNIFALKCDIKKFFDSVNHDLLIKIFDKKIKDDDAMWLLSEIVRSFISKDANIFEHKGMPIGNLTSQLFANVYMNEFDQFMKHGIHAKHYLRYTDDFVVISDSKDYLEKLIPQVNQFLKEKLGLDLHPNKVTIRKFRQGIDFLGYVILPHHQQIRTKTKKRIFKKVFRRVLEQKQGLISNETLEQSLQSYLGVLGHADSYKLSQELKN